MAESPVEPAGRVEEEFTADKRGWFLLDEVSIELSWTRAEGPAYGLLGCTFNRSNTGGTRLRVLTGGDGCGAVYREALHTEGDAVRSGLPEAFGRSVLAGAMEELRVRGSAPAGELLFTAAAYSASSSDAEHFRRLGQCCVRLLDQPIELDEFGASRLLREMLASWS